MRYAETRELNSLIKELDNMYVDVTSILHTKTAVLTPFGRSTLQRIGNALISVAAIDFEKEIAEYEFFQKDIP